MLRAFFIRLIGFILITSSFAQLYTLPARADSAEDVHALNLQAVQLHNQGEYAEAFEIARQALALAETALGPEHPDTLRSVNNLATLHDTQGRYAEAEPLYQRVLAVREKVLGREHPETLTSVNNRGFLYRAQGRYAEAEPLYQRALEGFEATLGLEDPATLRSERQQSRLSLSGAGALWGSRAAVPAGAGEL